LWALLTNIRASSTLSHPVFALVERDGHSHSFRVANISGDELRPLIVTHADRKSALMTDEGGQYFHIGKEFARHEKINHSR